MVAYLEIGPDVYRLDSTAPIIGMKVNNGLVQMTIPTTDGLGEVTWGAVNGVPQRMIVHVHAFSSDENEITVDPAKSALLGVPNTLVVCPRLFGPAGNPNTCGSSAQLAHLDDVISWGKKEYGIKDDRIGMVGVSGGAGLGPTYMGAYPGVVSVGSFWNGYFNLAQWHDESVAATNPTTVYWQLMEQTFGGPPTGTLAARYLAQSPAGVVGNIKNCTIYINDGTPDPYILQHHRTDFAAALQALPASAKVTSIYRTWGGGHAVDWPTAVSQLQSGLP